MESVLAPSSARPLGRLRGWFSMSYLRGVYMTQLDTLRSGYLCIVSILIQPQPQPVLRDLQKTYTPAGKSRSQKKTDTHLLLADLLSSFEKTNQDRIYF